MTYLNMDYEELKVIERSEKLTLDRTAIYTEVLNAIKDSLQDKLEAEYEEAGFADSDFDLFLESSSAFGVGPITNEQMGVHSEYVEAYLVWVWTMIGHCDFLLKTDYMDEFIDTEDDCLEDVIGEWAWESVNNIGDDATHAILIRFS